MILPVMNTQQLQLLLKYKIDFKEPVDLRIIGVDASRQKTMFFDRIANPGRPGIFELDFPMPITPEKFVMGFRNDTNDDENAYSIKSLGIYYLPKANVALTQDEIAFMNFLQWFAANASYLPYGTYRADTSYHGYKGQPGVIYSIKYTEDIIDDVEGRLETPARMDHVTAEMQFAGRQIKLMTVPKIVVVGVHEGTHYKYNTKDESFCDLNSLRICLGLGYPKSECLYAFTDIFNDDAAGKMRIANIQKYMDNFKYQGF